ncbi:MAG: ribbon-helix-helix protein, CopG family [Euryarchaeota archaeon]|nr:ribbon-helix-helix protein, CopG family [Euryarchaeota archaeon]MDE1880602.1 ribbon-helix-helix protein, CopG family [Euryarchaeota archaeon]MDE2044392.1 ribbon-helix-helix protein, CopG family [Thermoplasmata archaeon]
MKSRANEERYLGVRLSQEELAHLDTIVEERGFANRSEAVRHVLREAGEAGVPQRAPGEQAPRGRLVDVPVSLCRELERSIANGFSGSLEAALEKALELGLGEVAQQRARRMETDRRTAEQLSKDEEAQHGAAQEGERRGGV